MMAVVTVALVRGSTWVSRAIQWQTRSVYSHAAVFLPDGVHVIEAYQGHGVRQYLPTIAERMEQMDLFSVRCTEAQAARVYAWLRSRVGEGYDYLSVLRFVSRRRARRNARWFCSELVMEAFAQAGVVLLARVEGWKVSPGMLAMSPLLRR